MTFFANYVLFNFSWPGTVFLEKKHNQRVTSNLFNSFYFRFSNWPIFKSCRIANDKEMTDLSNDQKTAYLMQESDNDSEAFLKETLY